MEDRRFSRFASFVLVYNVAVVLFGAVVRATASGAGCGARWPGCGGSLVPASGSEAKTFIEFSHRATSGLAVALVFVLAVWAVRSRPKGDAARWMALAAAVLIVNEALIGAALVLFEWVADDESVGRLVSIVVHLVNTFLLLGALGLVVWFGAGRRVARRPFRSRHLRLVGWGAAGLVTVAALGAITALGDTLFPPDAVGAEFVRDFGGTLIVRLRWVHPIIAVVTAGYLVWMVRRLDSPSGVADALTALIYVQVLAGLLNIALLAPVWMQVVHLLLADAVWISFVVVAVDALARDDALVAGHAT